MRKGRRVGKREEKGGERDVSNRRFTMKIVELSVVSISYLQSSFPPPRQLLRYPQCIEPRFAREEMCVIARTLSLVLAGEGCGVSWEIGFYT